MNGRSASINREAASTSGELCKLSLGWGEMIESGPGQLDTDRICSSIRLKCAACGGAPKRAYPRFTRFSTFVLCARDGLCSLQGRSCCCWWLNQPGTTLLSLFGQLLALSALVGPVTPLLRGRHRSLLRKRGGLDGALYFALQCVSPVFLHAIATSTSSATLPYQCFVSIFPPFSIVRSSSPAAAADDGQPSEW